MKKDIERILRSNPGMKSKEISKQLSLEKKAVNSFLYSQRDIFRVDDEYRWFISDESFLKIEFPQNRWVDSALFEQSIISINNFFDSTIKEVTLVIPSKCNMLLDATAKLLALCNQLVNQKKKVTVDFNSCKPTMHYFNRLGFFDQLSLAVSVLPSRPNISRAELYKGSNDSLMEFGIIDLEELDESIPKQLKMTFVSHVGDEYSQPAFTVISELFGNVIDHSETLIPGLAALQLYKGRNKHIQTVVSDNGKGIIGTLSPILPVKYPELAEKFDLNCPKSALKLIVEIFEKGEISQSMDDARGLGLKKSRDVAAKFNAHISIRQESFEVKLIYKEGKLDNYESNFGLSKLFGTHVCFDFFLD